TLRKLIEIDDGQQFSIEALRAVVFSFTKEDEAFARELLERNQQLTREIGEQLAARRKLLDELAKRRSAADPIAGYDLNQLEAVNQELERELREFERKTNLLRKELEAAGKK